MRVKCMGAKFKEHKENNYALIHFPPIHFAPIRALLDGRLLATLLATLLEGFIPTKQVHGF